MSIAFSEAEKTYASLNVDVEKAFARLAEIPVSLHCWQGDDNDGFEGGGLDGGILVTGNYPGKPTSPRELRNDMELAFSLIPGKKRIALHSIYAETGGEKMARNELRPEHFANWMAWAKDCGIGLDFNPTFYSHEQFKNGMTLSHPDASVRKFWIEHGIACRKIGEAIGKHLGTPCVNNFWIPDGFKDTPFDRYAPRKRLEEALDEIFAVPVDTKHNIDSVESKLFGIGVESCSVGSHEFYLGYAVKNKKLLCLDSGHFHPTEVISDKISSCLLFVNELLLHVSRGVRWDSDHVVTLSDELEAIASEVIRHDFDKRVHIGLDFFDGSINRVAAWVIGARNMFRALLLALLEPAALLRDAEARHDNTARLVLMEEMKSLPFGAVWEEYCRRNNVPEKREWLEKVRAYEAAEFPGRVRK